MYVFHSFYSFSTGYKRVFTNLLTIPRLELILSENLS